MNIKFIVESLPSGSKFENMVMLNILFFFVTQLLRKLNMAKITVLKTQNVLLPLTYFIALTCIAVIFFEEITFSPNAIAEVAIKDILLLGLTKCP